MKTSTIILEPVNKEPSEILPTVEIRGNEAYSVTPVPQYGEGLCEYRLVMTKEIFQEMYKKWIVDEELNS